MRMKCATVRAKFNSAMVFKALKFSNFETKIQISGQVDIVIANAAILFFALTLDLSDRELRAAYDVNLLGTVNVRYTSIDYRFPIY